VKGLRCVIVATVAWLFTCASAGAASVAAPSNDTFAGATAIAALPFSQTLDTTEAATDADDAETNANCGAPATDASVWYAFTPSSDQIVLVDVSQSNYSAGAIVVTGAPGSFSLRTCGPRRVAFSATSGQTYYILAFDDTPGGVNGGTLEISVTQAPPPPELHLAIDPVGHFNARAGTATVTGTFTCTGILASPVFIDGQLSQQVGRFTISGFGFGETSSACDGTSQRWSLIINGGNGKFAGGQATLSVFAFACGPFRCGFDQQTQTIRLRR
jgi:Family of unknown function (DUF6299)